MGENDPYIGLKIYRPLPDRGREFGRIVKTTYRAGATLPGQLIEIDVSWFATGTTTIGISAEYLFACCTIWVPMPNDPAKFEEWLDA